MYDLYIVFLSSSANLTILDRSLHVHELSQALQVPRLEEYLRRFLFECLSNDTQPHSVNATDISTYPPLTSRVSVYRSAVATFYAPSELSGTGGLHSEIIRANPAWRRDHPRFDTVLINLDSGESGMKGCAVGRVRAFLSISHEQMRYPCALIDWFKIVGRKPANPTGMWVVRPDMRGRERVQSVISIDSIIRAVHLIPVYQGVVLPVDFSFSVSLDAFKHFYVNKYADYHSHKCLI